MLVDRLGVVVLVLNFINSANVAFFGFVICFGLDGGRMK